MYWLIALFVTFIAVVINLVAVGSVSALGMAGIVLTWMTGLFYGVFTLIAGLQHLFNSEKIASYIGWQTNGFQHELGWMEVGLGLSGVLAALIQGNALYAVAVIGTALYLGAAIVHYREMHYASNFSAGNAGAVFYIDLVMPLVTIFSMLTVLLAR